MHPDYSSLTYFGRLGLFIVVEFRPDRQCLGVDIGVVDAP